MLHLAKQKTGKYMDLILCALIGIIVGAAITYLIVSESLKDRTKAEIGKIKEENEAALMEKENTFKKLEEEKEANHAKMLGEKEKSYKEMIEVMDKNHARSLEDKEKEHNATIARIKESHDAALEQMDKAHKAALDQRDKAHEEAMENLKAYFASAINALKTQIKSDTEDMLKQRQKEFSDHSTKDIGDIVSPLKDALGKMHKAITEGDMERSKLSGEMQEQIKNMVIQAERARESADELTRAFKHESKMQGNLGEVVLYELLKANGLTEGLHFHIQSKIKDARGGNVKSEEGKTLVPDVILHLDDKREVIIDSKVSIKAFIEYVNSETEADKEKWLKEHVESLMRHVKELAAKDYSSYIQPPKIKMNYVIMFVPNSGALWTALNAKPDLWRSAMEKNVYIADEQTLFAALKIISLTWIQITQAQNHAEVYKLADEMIKRVGMFINKYKDVGEALDKAKSAYDEGTLKLGDKGQSIIKTSNQLLELGAKQSDRYPIPKIGEGLS